MRGGLLAAGVGLFLVASVFVYKFPISRAHRVPYPPLLSYLGLGLALVSVVLFIAGLALAAKSSVAEDRDAGTNPLVVPDYITRVNSSTPEVPPARVAAETAPTTPVPLGRPTANSGTDAIASVEPRLVPDQLGMSALPAIINGPGVSGGLEGDPTAGPGQADDGGFCPYCGAKAEPEFKFCRSCGKELGEKPTPPANDQASALLP